MKQNMTQGSKHSLASFLYHSLCLRNSSYDVILDDISKLAFHFPSTRDFATCGVMNIVVNAMKSEERMS